MLNGYRVLDLTDAKGLLAGRVFGDLGADVIKIEKPGGDDSRRIGPFYHDTVDPEKSLFWFVYSMNKRSITLDIETTEGRRLLKELAKRADFVIESFPPGRMDELGLGYEALSEVNRRLVFVSISGFGQSGPYSRYKASDLVVWAMSGIMYLSGNPERPPVRISAAPQSYLHASIEAVVGALVAHYDRETSGEGQRVDVSAQHRCTWITMEAPYVWETDHVDQTRCGGNRWRVNPTGVVRVRSIFPCQDGFVLAYLVGGRMGEPINRGLSRWMKEEGIDDGHLKTTGWPLLDMSSITQEELEEIYDCLQRMFARHTRAELYEEAVTRKVMMAPVNGLKEACESQQLRERGFWVEVAHEGLGGEIVYPGPWAVLSETPLARWRRAPRIGEHNAEIYQQELGLTPREMDLLARARIV